MLGLVDRAECGEGGGVGGGEGAKMKATSWMARKIMTRYQLLRSVCFSGRFRLKVGRLNELGGEQRGGGGGGAEMSWSYGMNG